MYVFCSTEYKNEIEILRRVKQEVIEDILNISERIDSKHWLGVHFFLECVPSGEFFKNVIDKKS